MDADRDNPTLAELLTPPASFVRENYSAYLFAPFSRKLSRRVYLYTPSAYALWVRLESDPGVAKFNERVSKFPIAIGDGSAKNASPRVISVDQASQVTVHSFNGDLAQVAKDPDTSFTISAWDNWAQLRGFKHIVWTSALLSPNPVELTNLKRLLRFVSAPGVFPDISLQQQLLAELRGVRRLTFSKLVELFPLSDPARVQSEIARLIVDRKIFSDIDRNPFSMITEVSAHRGLETD